MQRLLKSSAAGSSDNAGNVSLMCSLLVKHALPAVGDLTVNGHEAATHYAECNKSSRPSASQQCSLISSLLQSHQTPPLSCVQSLPRTAPEKQQR